jgi:glycosyltransferase involved in cell wall biosynthesis
MLSLIQNTQALLFPSFAEGWGMPLAEALTLNTAAICSDLPALRECGRTHSIYLNPLDGLAWKAAILNALNTKPQLKSPYLPDRWEDHLNKLDELLISLETPS